MPKSVCDVTLATWSTHHGAGNGLGSYLDAKLFGGNVGHASLCVTFPANEQTKEWLRKYCLDPPIPYELQKVVTHKATLDANGKPVKTNEILAEEEVYIVNFSWFPPHVANEKFSLSTSRNSDGMNERTGVHVNWDPRFDFTPEQRVHQGRLGSRLMTYGARTVVHERNLDPNQKKLIQLESEETLLFHTNNSLALHIDKLKETTRAVEALDQREKNLSKRSECISERNEKLLAMLKIKNDLVAKSSMDNYTPHQQQTFEAITGIPFATRKEVSDEQRQDLLTKVKAAHQLEVKALAAFKKDTPEKIAKERQKLSELSTTTNLMLDRLVPKWREQIQLPAGQVLTSPQRKQLLSVLESLHENNAKQLDVFEKQIREVSNLVHPTLSFKIKGIEKQIEEIKKAGREVMMSLASDRLNKDLHKQQLLLEKEIKALQKDIIEIKGTKQYQFEHVNGTVLRDWRDVEKHLSKLLDTSNNFTKGQSIQIPSRMIDDLNSAFSHFVDESRSKTHQKYMKAKFGWEANHIKADLSFRKITFDEAVALQAFVKKQIAENQDKAFELETAATTIGSQDFELNLTHGALPDNVIHMPIDQAGGFEPGNQSGLNVEAMLKEMHEITIGREFNLDSNNCSVTVGRVLQAGAKGEYLKAQFQDRALGAIGNPQMVLNNAENYNEALSSPKDSTAKKVGRFNPIKAAGGWCVNKLMVENNVPLSKKIAAGLAIGPVALAAGAIAGVKKLSNPVQSLKELRHFVEYANSRPSVGFKVGAILLATPAIAALAIPAALVYAREKMTDGFSYVSNKLFNKSTKKASLDDNVDLKGKDLSKGQTIEASMQSALREQVVTVKGKNLKEALDNFKQALDTHKGPVVLDAKTEKAVLKQLASIKDVTKREEATSRYNSLCQESIARVQAIQQPIVQQEIATVPAAATAAMPQAAVVATPKKDEDIVLLEPHVIKSQQQFYAVMPILGDELATQIESYSMYYQNTHRVSEEQKKLGIPRTVDPAQLTANDGYLINQAERDFIVACFKKDSSLKEIPKGTAFPAGHPLAGKALSCDAFKAGDNIYVSNNTVLGSGSFGTVKVVQAIDAPKPGKVSNKGFYAVKIQNVDENVPEQTLARLQQETAMNALFDLHYGEMEITHDIISKAPVYALASDAADLTKAAADKQAAAAVDQAVENEAEEEANVNAGTMINLHEDNEEEANVNAGTMLNVGTMINVEATKSDAPANEEAGAKSENPEQQEARDALAAALERYKKVDPTTVPLTDEANEAKAAAKAAKDKLLAEREIPKVVDIKNDISTFDMLHYLSLFEKMTSAVENVHSKGVLHRDIKAENFLYDAAKDEMRLIDFGLALRLDSPNLPNPADDCVGSPHNFAPEHFDEGYTKPLSTKQDICALARTCGLLLHGELLKYNVDAFRTDVPSPDVPAALRDSLESNFLENFQFKNADNNPQIQVMNQMLALLAQMGTAKVENRPEASEIKQRLQAMIQNYQNTLQAAQVKQVIPSIQVAPQSAAHTNVLANLSQLDDLAARHSGTKALISYAKSNLESAKDIDISMTQLLAELSKSTTPKDRRAFTADLVRTFEQMKKTPIPQVAALASSQNGANSHQDNPLALTSAAFIQQNIAPVSSPNGANSHQVNPLAFTSYFESSRNRSQPMLVTQDRAALSKNVEANLDKLNELAKCFYVDGDDSKVPALVKYFKGELKGSPNVEATMGRLLNELMDDKRFMSNDENRPSFKEAVKEVFSEMKKPKNQESNESAVAIRMT
jgi:serine/threonine protein kinase